VKIPPGIAVAYPPLNEYVAVRVIGSPSLSIKKEERSIGVRMFYRAVTAGGVKTNLGLVFMIFKV
jgi:uridine phosphorylase